eukprot:SAG31_NODE_65_length_28565_cov_8.402914_9_plen_121_part_00
MLNLTQHDPKAAATAPQFSILREWEDGPNSTLRLVFKVTNTGPKPLEVGGLGIAMPFAWAAGSDAGDAASTFTDPAITGDHGYVTVTRLSGECILRTPSFTLLACSCVHGDDILSGALLR